MNILRENTLAELEEKIGFDFQNKDLLDVALTHSSYTNHKKNAKYNERLEFLGDAVLELVISDFLFNKYKNKSEGELTKTRAIIVCENSLHSIAKNWDIGKYINMSKGEEMTGGRTRVSILADCIEAIIAAVYIEKGFDGAKRFVLTNFGENIHKAINNQIIMDHKTKLQEVMQQHGEISIEYNLLKYEGPPHRRKFYIEVYIDGKSFGKGEGYSKKEAEQNAAKEALNNLEVING
ncbi:ribonuclease III [Haloimpatiens lingqiaonensis]|uniref:ribonuclease III n=1 Tax=Haloimpatiens lingqiaonensis TaxID=1380675 RepID=UPI0010FD10E2|nr:ribonuclease III [Haloimpatiens lingqiaonensis]